jgi:hypothetical protein
MESIERRVQREVRGVTRREVITKAIAEQLSWAEAAASLRITVWRISRVRRWYKRFRVCPQ